jgi:ABC-2 type transport system permease protein
MRSFVIAGRLIKQISGDKRTLALILLAPVFILFILHIVLTSGVTQAKFDVVNTAGADMSVLEQNAIVTYPAGEDAALADLKSGKCDAYLVVRDGGDKLVIEGSDPTLTALVKGTYAKYASDKASRAMQEKFSAVGALLAKLPDNVKKLVKLPDLTVKAAEPEISTLYAGDFEFFDTIAAGIMGFIIFFLVFLLSGISFLRERISGTLERTMASSVRRWEIVAGYLLGFGLFVVIQTVIIQSFLLYVLKIHFVGSFWAILLVNLVSAAASLALGTLLSAFARNEFQLFQFIPIIIIPQILFSGLFDLREAPNWVHWLSQIFPLTYASQALRDMMIRGKGLGDVWVDVVVLAGFTVLFMVLNILALKKYRRA